MRTLLSIVAVWLASALPGCAGASSAPLSEYTIDIDRQSLASALRLLALQTDYQIGKATPCGDDLLVGPLRGTYTVEAGLRILLIGTGFTFSRVNERRTLAVIPDSRTVKCFFDIAREPLGVAVGRFGRQANLQVAFAPRNARENRVVARAIKGLHTIDAALSRLLQHTGFTYQWINERMIDIVPIPRRRSARVKADDSRTWRPDEAEKVLVTGSRLYEFAGGVGGGAAPVTVFDRERIEELGVSTIGDLLRYIPQQPYVFDDIYRLDGVKQAALRGLGNDTTLVLINGRRTSGTATNDEPYAFDVNSIPLVAVKRVEVLFDSSTAVYGTDAIGGVVNIVLRAAIPPLATVRYGASDGGAYERRASVSAGHANDRFEGSFVLDYFERDALLGEERDRWRNMDYRRFGASDLRVPQSNPGNVRSLTGANLPGLSSSSAAVPTGSSGVGLVPADFAATAGGQNLSSVLRYWSISPTTERPSVSAVGELQITPQLSGFGEFLYARRHTLNQSNPPRLSVIVPATNAFNPFGVPVAMDYLLTGVGPQPHEADGRLVRIVSGIKGRRRDWDWEAVVQHSDDYGRMQFGSNLNGARIASALASSDPAQALNVFQDGPGGSPALLASLTAKPLELGYGWRVNQGSVMLRGPIWTLPSGSIDAVLGGEWRDENLRTQIPGPLVRDRKVSSTFGEFRLPVVNPMREVPALNELSLIIAARLDHYDDFGPALNPQYGLVWRPHTDWALRASYSESFDPPSLNELHEQQIEERGFALDRRRNEITEVTFRFGGNSTLDASEAESFSLGVSFTPASLSPMRLTARYWRTSIDNRIVSAGPDAYLANEASFPGRILRSPPTTADIAAGLPGKLTFVDFTRNSFGHVRTHGIDLEGSYRIDTPIGDLTPSVSATRVDEFVDYMLGTAPKDRMGVASPRGTIPRWRAVATIGWERRALRLTATARFTSSYGDTMRLAWTGRKVSAQTLVDLQGVLDLDDVVAAGSFLEGCTLAAGVINLLDKEPRFSEVNQSYGYDWSQGDLRQRFGYLRLSKQF